MEQREQTLLERAERLNSWEEFEAWEQRFDEYLESLEEDLSRGKRSRLSIGARQSVIARIARLEAAKDAIRQRFAHAGAGYGAREDDVGLRWREIETAFVSRLSTGAVINSKHIDPRRFLEDAKNIVLDRVRNVILEHNNIKVNTVFNGEFVSGDKRANKSVTTKNCELFRTSDLHEWYESRVIEPTLAFLEEFQERDSGWALSRILNLIVNVNKYNPLHAGCVVELPREIKLKRAVINVRSKGNACFAWSVVAALHPTEENTHCESSYPHYTSVLKLQGIEFPMTLKQIKKFEDMNDISVNVYAIEKKKELAILPIRLGGKKKRHVNLLYVEDPRDCNVGHFAYIKNLSRLVSSQISRKNSKKYFCDRCLHYFSSIVKLEAHGVDCREMNDCAIRLPKDDDDEKWLSFSNYSRKERVPFVVYADLECVLEKTNKESTTFTRMYQHHRVFSIGYYVRCSYDDSLCTYRFRRDKECVTWFVEELSGLAHRVKSLLSVNVPMADFTKDDWQKFNNATHCHVCEKPFTPNETRVRDHCHLTGRYRGPAHSNCNTKLV